MQFKDIIGQEQIKTQLVASVERGRISHAQLFVGEEGYGTLPLAIAYAQYLNCKNRHDGDSCGVCPSCHQIAQAAHPDLHFVFPVNTPKGKSSSEKPISVHFMKEWREAVVSHNSYFDEQMWYEAIDIDNKQGNISTFEADEIIKKLSFKAFESEYKVVIIFLAERMNTQAANKLLKILEEPWDKTIFLLVSRSPEQLLQTILSRTQTVQIPMISDEVLTQYLQQKYGSSIEEAQRRTHIARGNLISAMRMADTHESDNEFFDYFVRLMRLSYEDKHMELLELADTMASLGREEQKRMLAYFLKMIRDCYMMTAGMGEIAYIFGDEYAFCKKFAPFVNNNNIEGLIQEIEQAVHNIVRNGNPRIMFPHFVLSLSKKIVKL